MAIARITASRDWHLAAAEILADLPKARRELLYAAGVLATRSGSVRSSGMAEMDADEVRVLAERLPDDDLVRRALAEVTASEVRDRARSRRVRAMMDVHRGSSGE